MGKLADRIDQKRDTVVVVNIDAQTGTYACLNCALLFCGLCSLLFCFVFFNKIVAGARGAARRARRVIKSSIVRVVKMLCFVLVLALLRMINWSKGRHCVPKACAS